MPLSLNGVPLIYWNMIVFKGELLICCQNLNNTTEYYIKSQTCVFNGFKYISLAYEHKIIMLMALINYLNSVARRL